VEEELPLLHTNGPWINPAQAAFWNAKQSTEVLLLSRSKPFLTLDNEPRLGLFGIRVSNLYMGANQGTNMEKFPIKIIFPASASAGKLIVSSIPFPSTSKLPPTELSRGIDKPVKFVLLEMLKAPCPVVTLPTEVNFGAENDGKVFP
jgi:hypothetical protein